MACSLAKRVFQLFLCLLKRGNDLSVNYVRVKVRKRFAQNPRHPPPLYGPWTSSFHTAVRTVLPFHSISRGKRTFSEGSCAI